MTKNILIEETSPYLRQHKDNPVHWQPWNKNALTRAREENKPILLSVGYSACHWCHVMAHESFENAEIAALMNEHFINIKVDREERPDIDIIYQTALNLMGERGGWPLTMFLTPGGDPYWGGTYFPATRRYGRAAFPEILRSLAEAYHTQGDKVRESVAALKDAMGALSQPTGGAGINRAVLDGTAKAMLAITDGDLGGTRGAPKFPQVSLFRYLWKSYQRTNDRKYRAAVTLTLDHLCRGGIYDHLGGGFARYSTDEFWLVPHFEKMLYDNALLVDLLCETWLETKNPLYASRIDETINWVMRDMTVSGEDGASGDLGFASALDADSEGAEGTYYVWSETEIDTELGAGADQFKKSYDVTARGNWEGKVILNRSGCPETGDDEHELFLADCRKKLLAVRTQRVPPGRDHKVLADWNGLMIHALAFAGASFDRPDWIDAAQRAFDFVCTNMIRDGRLLHSWCDGRAQHAAVIDDYANMSRAALALYEATGEAACLDQAAAWVETANRHYWDEEFGGYYFTADEATDVIVRTKTIADNATPSGNAIMAEVSSKLFCHTGNEVYRQTAEKIAAVFSGGAPHQLINQPGLLSANDALNNPCQIVIIATDDEGATDALVTAALQSPVANRVISRIAPGLSLPDYHPAFGKGARDGKPVAYVCRGQVCGAPHTDADDLARDLETTITSGPQAIRQ